MEKERKGRRYLWGIALIVGAAAMFAAVPVTAAMANQTPATAARTMTYAATCSGNTSLNIGATSPAKDTKPAKILSITWTAVDDEDSGFAGYWAMDTYTSSVTVWLIKTGPQAGSYFAVQTFSGSFQVPQGAMSPENAVSELAPGYGTLSGLIFGYISSSESFHPGSNPVSGNLGDINYGGTTSDILLGTYGNGQTGDASEYNWYTTYFSPASGTDFPYSWGFTYNLNSAFQTNQNGGSTSVNQWCDFDGGSYGDIVTAA